MQERAFKGEDIVRFLKHLLRRIKGKLLLIWDGLPAHRGQVVKQFLRQGAAKRLRLERLPGYAPDLNPDEGWSLCVSGCMLTRLDCAEFSKSEH